MIKHPPRCQVHLPTLRLAPLPLAGQSHAAAPQVLGHANGSTAAGNHTETESTEDAGFPALGNSRQMPCRGLLLHPTWGAEQSLEGAAAGPWGGVPISPCRAKSYASVAQTAHVLECIAPTTHPQLPVAILEHISGAGHPQKLLLGVQTPPGASGPCFSRLLVQHRGALAGGASSGAICFTSH